MVCFNKPKIEDKKKFIKSTKPTIPISTLNFKLDYSVKINTTEKLKVLKEKIGEILNLNLNKFIIKKYGPSGKEIRDLNEKISTVMQSDFKVFVEFGTPVGEDEILLNVNFCELDFSVYKLYPYKITFIENFIVNKDSSVQEVKKDLIKLVENKLGTKLNEEFTLIREMIQERPSRVK